MTNGKMIALVGLAGVGGYFLLRRDPRTGLSELDMLTSRAARDLQSVLPTNLPGGLSGQGPAQPSSKSTVAIGVAGVGASLAATLFGAGGATAATAAGASAATGGTAAATAGGIGTAATVGITAGIGAAVLLTWAIWKKGLFRGGDEALHVSPARNQFLAQFAKYDYMRDGNPPGFYGLALILSVLQPGSNEPGAPGLFHTLNAADHMDEFNAATAAILARLKQATKAEDAAIIARLQYYGYTISA